MRHLPAVVAALVLGSSVNAHAAAPSVAVDIAPLHSLVSQVMEGVGEANLLIPAGASPHHYTLRPSEASALEDADVVFWIGGRLSPWLGKALNNLAGSAQSIEALDIEGTTIYPTRESATFEAHGHDEDEGHEGEDHEEDKGHKEDEHHESNDPHAWLDPENAKLWVRHISEVLSEHDPSNASSYSRNADNAVASLDDLILSTRDQISGLGEPRFIVFHDAYQYFEKRFGIIASGSIKLSDAEDPSPSRIREVQDLVIGLGVSCVFTEPQYNPGIVKTVFESTGVSTTGVMDPLGASLQRGKDHYRELIEGMVDSLSQCQ